MVQLTPALGQSEESKEEMTKRIKKHFQTNKGKLWREAGERLVAESKAVNESKEEMLKKIKEALTKPITAKAIKNQKKRRVSKDP